MSRLLRVIALTALVVVLGSGSATAGLVIGSTITVGFPPHNYTTLATNIVNHAFNNSVPAANQYAIFQTHDPWGGTMVKNAITGAGHTFTVFTPAQLAGFPFNTYRVVVLNWDDTFLFEFNTEYQAAIPALQNYVVGGGVVWIQGAIQGNTGDSYNLPFGGSMTWDLQGENDIVNAASPMVQGVANPIFGNSASHARVANALPPTANVVVVVGPGGGGPGTLYDLVQVPVELQTFSVE
jgi:hypothetical protein